MEVVLIPCIQDEADIKSRVLVRLLPNIPMESITFYETYTGNQTLAPRVRKVMNWVATEAKALTDALPDRNG